MPKSSPTNWKVVIGLLLLGALLALPAGMLSTLVLSGEPHDLVKPAYTKRPLPFLLHAMPGVVFWLLMPFQFSPRLRAKWPTWHRIGGRLAVLSALILGLSSIWLVAFFPTDGGFLRHANLLITGAGTVVAFGYAISAACRKDFNTHRVWMMRAVAIIYGAATTAIVSIPLYLTFGEFPYWLTEIDRWAGVALNLAVVEWILRRENHAEPVRAD